MEVSAEPRHLTISGRHESSKEEKKGKAVYSETCSKNIFRVVDLPTEIDTAKVNTTLKDGVLQLTMSKAAKAVQVQPQAAA
jgi:HSP20 family molecular chaperone IbpA